MVGRKVIRPVICTAVLMARVDGMRNRSGLERDRVLCTAVRTKAPSNGARPQVIAADTPTVVVNHGRALRECREIIARPSISVPFRRRVALRRCLRVTVETSDSRRPSIRSSLIYETCGVTFGYSCII